MNEETLILLVQTYTELYDMSDPKYSNQQRKDQCWEEIAEAMKETAEECKLAWRRLRDAYRKAKKIRQTKSGAAASKKRPWKFENQMAFLAPFMSERETRSNISESVSTPESQTSSIEEEPASIISDGDDNDEESSSINNYNISASNTANSSSVTQQSAIFRKTPTKKKTAATNPPSDVAGALLKYLKDKPEKLINGDVGPLDTFFLAMAETVKSFPPHFQVEVKFKVFELINNYEIRVVTNTLNQVPHPLMPQLREQMYATNNNTSTIFDYPPRNLDAVTQGSNITDTTSISSNFTHHQL